MKKIHKTSTAHLERLIKREKEALKKIEAKKKDELKKKKLQKELQHLRNKKKAVSHVGKKR